MDSLMNIVIFLLGLSVLVMVHELGHFITAKLFNVYCYEFAIGIGPKIISKKGKETRFSLRALPIGGFVSMAGEGVEDNPAEKETDEENKTEDEKQDDIEKIDVPYERTINGIAAWKRFIVMASGVIMNFLIAFIFFFWYLMAVGVLVTNVAKVDVTEKIDGKETPFHYVGISKDDTILSVKSTFFINNSEFYVGKLTSVNTYDDISYAVSLPNELLEEIYKDNTLSTIENNKKVFASDKFYQKMEVTLLNPDDETNPSIRYPERSIESITITKEVKDEKTYYNGSDAKLQLWGITPVVRAAKIGESLKNAGTLEYQNGILIFEAIGKLFTKEGFQNVGGIVKMYEYSAQFADYGFAPYLAFLGMISVNLGVMNLLPIPALDGSQLLIILAEGVSGQKIPSRVKAIINFIGFIFLMGLMVVITCKDIIGLF